MRSPWVVACWALSANLLLPAACGSDNAAPGTDAASGSGGGTVPAETGGKVGTGGRTATGGDSGPGTGGKSGSGGEAGSGSGGKSGTGGASASSGTGGRPGTGGSVGGGSGGSGAKPGSGGSTGIGGLTGTGGGTSGGSGGGPGATRKDGACQAGVTYPAPTLSGTPKQLYKSAGTSNGTFEGPVWLSSSSTLLFSDITFTTPVNPSQLWKLTPPATVATFLQDAGTNGLAVDGAGNVFGCSHKVQGIVKLDVAAATLTTVVDTVGGKHFNSPNDLVIRSDGTIYFTDPDYQLGSRTSETGKKGIYRVSPAGAVSVVDDTFTQPNGITLSPDETVLYVADYVGNAVRTFAVAADGSTSGRKDFATVSSPDGFGMDCAGNLYVASGGNAAAVVVFAPAGTKLGSITVASSTSNVAFGGSDGKTLYITAGKALYSLDMNVPGYFD